jgi:hypothetical protein
LAGSPEVLKDEAKGFAALPTEIPMRSNALLNIARCFDALKRSESVIQIQIRPKIPLTPGIGHLLEKATGILQPVL